MNNAQYQLLAKTLSDVGKGILIAVPRWPVHWKPVSGSCFEKGCLVLLFTEDTCLIQVVLYIGLRDRLHVDNFSFSQGLYSEFAHRRFAVTEHQSSAAAAISLDFVYACIEIDRLHICKVSQEPSSEVSYAFVAFSVLIVKGCPRNELRLVMRDPVQPFGEHRVQVQFHCAVPQQVQRALIQRYGVVHEAVEVIN